MNSVFDNLQGKVSGKILSENFTSNEYLDFVFPSLVSENAPDALKKISDFYGVSPSIDGNNINGIVEIRNNLFNITEDKRLLNSFTIVASHTHWKDRKPTIYKFVSQNNKFIIGPHKVDFEKNYLPVSFVFNKEFPIPYEWIDKSVLLNEDEWKMAVDVIIKLNTEVYLSKLPFGVSIDFRFKSSLFDNAEASVELPIEDEKNEYDGYSYIIPRSYFIENEYRETTEQVSWHAKSDLMYDFNQPEKEVLNDLRTVLNSFSNDKEREQFLNDLEIKLDE